jgi:bd-type cytochrome oxidase subunit I
MGPASCRHRIGAVPEVECAERAIQKGRDTMDDPTFWHRLQFGFTITFHYLFPQLTMGLAWFLVFWKWRALRTGDERDAAAARFWARIFGLTFAVGVVTGIPMEFQFGTNWSEFSRYAGGVIGQTLAMEGMFAFLFESAFVGALVWGEKRMGARLHFFAALAVAVGVFPVMLHSTLDPEYSLTVYNSATAEHGLMVALFWWPAALVLALTYSAVVMRNYGGKVQASEDTRGSY